MKINSQKTLLFAAIVLLLSNAEVNAQWSLSGNAAAAGNFIGTTNAIDFITKTNNIERMRITAAGNVGIGTTAPEDQLQVGFSYVKLVMGNAQGANLGYGTSYMGFNMSRQSLSTWSTTSDGGNNGGAAIFSNLVGSLYFSTLGTTGSSNRSGITDATVLSSSKLYIRGTDGNVGIGTLNPTARLTVNGSVLIGDATTNLAAGYKLYVQTGILTEKLRVSVANSAEWADYVFNANYKLRSINELETFVKTNKHLPNVPSAEDVVKEGIDMAKMDAKLLEKIEELSLYIIQQNKRIEAMEQKLADKQ